MAATTPWKTWRMRLLGGVAALLMTACGGGTEDSPKLHTRSLQFGDRVSGTVPEPPIEQGNAPFQTVLHPVQPQVPSGNGGGTPATQLIVHYQHSQGDTAGWQLHSWGAGADPGWNQGHNPVRSDAFGAVYEVPLTQTSGSVGYLFHKGDEKDHGGADQSWTLQDGKNEIWRKQGDPTTYSSPPAGGPPAVPDLHTVRVHYLRPDGNYGAWGLHLWPWNGMDVARMPAGSTINQWNAPVAFAALGQAARMVA